MSRVSKMIMSSLKNEQAQNEQSLKMRSRKNEQSQNWTVSQKWAGSLFSGLFFASALDDILSHLRDMFGNKLFTYMLGS